MPASRRIDFRGGMIFKILLCWCLVKIVVGYICNKTDMRNFKMKMLPVEVLALASFLEKKKVNVSVINFLDMPPKKCEKVIRVLAPEALYLTIFSHNRIDSLKFVRDFKKRNQKITIAAGGPFITFVADEIAARYPEIDYLIMGEPENPLLKLIEGLRNKSEMPRICPPQMVLNMNPMPLPSEFSGTLINVDPNEQYKFLMTSRGSAENPMLSSYPKYSGVEIRPRSVKRIIQEIVRLQKKYGILYFIIRDDNFGAIRERVLEFCREIRERKIYIMWSCHLNPECVDEELLTEMKLAGLERVNYSVCSGSPRILQRYSGTRSEVMLSVARLTRKIGVYFTIDLITGFKDESASDVARTINLIKKILPGHCVIKQAVYQPGTRLYDEAIASGEFSPLVWFRKNQVSIPLREDQDVVQWMREISETVALIRQESWYDARSFRRHHAENPRHCWVTDILEGDYYLDENKNIEADRAFRKVVTACPENPWGYLRVGKVKFREGNFESAEQYFRTVTDLIPAYYGGWLRVAESLIAQGKLREARRWADEAYRRNRYDVRLHNVREVLKENNG